MTSDAVLPATEIPAKRPRGRPRKTVDERDDGNRRQALLAPAAQLFRRKGFDATTTRDIAAAAGMQSGSPFYHFKSKDALLYAVMEEGMRSALARLLAATQVAGLRRADSRPPSCGCWSPCILRCCWGRAAISCPSCCTRRARCRRASTRRLGQLIAEYETLWLPVLERPVRQWRIASAGAPGAAVDSGCAELVGAMV